MQKNNERVNSDLPMLRADRITMEYIRALMGEILKKEIFRLTAVIIVLGILFWLVTENYMLMDMVFGDHKLVQLALVLIGIGSALFIFGRYKKLQGDESEYGYIDGVVVKCYKKLFGFSIGVDLRQEYIDVLSDYGNIYSQIPVFKPYLYFLSSNVSAFMGTKSSPGSSVRIIRINKKTVFAVELKREFTPAKRKEIE